MFFLALDIFCRLCSDAAISVVELVSVLLLKNALSPAHLEIGSIGA